MRSPKFFLSVMAPVLGVAFFVFGTQPALAWENYVNHNFGPDGGKMAFDSFTGDLYVTGPYSNVTDKYETYRINSATGATVAGWPQQFASGNTDDPSAVTTDGNGNVYVMGTSSSNPGVATLTTRLVSYNSAGTARWNTVETITNSGTNFAVDDVPPREVVTPDNNSIYTVNVPYQFYTPPPPVFFTINKYATSNGVSAGGIWPLTIGTKTLTGLCTGGCNYADVTSVAINSTGTTLYLVGRSFQISGCATDATFVMSINTSTGAVGWVTHDCGFGSANDISLDSSGNIYVAEGSSFSGTSCQIMKLSSAGVIQGAPWPITPNFECQEIIAKGTNIYTGGYTTPTPYKYTAKVYNSSTGVLVSTIGPWQRTTFSDAASSLAVDNVGGVYLTGCDASNTGNIQARAPWSHPCLNSSKWWTTNTGAFLPPTVVSLSPTSGPIAGGTSVVVTGTNFTGATAVKFGATNATSFTVNSATQITATSPAAGVSIVDVTVTTPGGTSVTNAGDQYTYVSAPTVIYNADPGPPYLTTSIPFSGNLTGTGGTTVSETGAYASSTVANPQAGTGTKYTSCASNCPTGQFTATGTPLSPNTKYYYNFFATNSQGTSYSSPPHDWATAPGVPTMTAFTNTTGTGTWVNWTAPAGGAQTYSAQRCADAACVTVQQTWVSTSNPLVVSGLTSGTTYYFRVAATGLSPYNLPGSYSATSSVTTLSLPAITNGAASSINSSGATLTATLTSTGNDPSIVSGTCWATTAAPTTNCTGSGGHSVGVPFSDVVSGTMPGNSTIYFRGRAVNTVGTAYGIPDVSFLTKPGAPGSSPFTNQMTTSVTVNWTAPSGNGTITSYTVERCNAASCVYAPVTGSPFLGTVHSFNDSGLSSGNTYNYRITPSNATGAGTQLVESYSVNTPPTVVITQNLPGSVVVGKQYTIIAQATDPDAGQTLTGNGGTINGWSIVGGGGGATLTNPTGTSGSSPLTSTITFTATATGTYQVQYQVIDNGTPAATGSAVTPPTTGSRTLPTWQEVAP